MAGGGYRKKSGRSKSGWYKGIYCASTYELAWVIYRLDHDLEVKRYPGYLLTSKNERYYPDFIYDNNVIEIKGYIFDEKLQNRKKQCVLDKGHQYIVLFEKDLQKEFKWAKEHYHYEKLEQMYDGYKFSYEKICKKCGVKFLTDRENKIVCSRACTRGLLKGKHLTEEQRNKISHSLMDHKTSDSTRLKIKLKAIERESRRRGLLTG